MKIFKVIPTFAAFLFISVSVVIFFSDDEGEKFWVGASLLSLGLTYFWFQIKKSN